MSVRLGQTRHLLLVERVIYPGRPRDEICPERCRLSLLDVAILAGDRRLVKLLTSLGVPQAWHSVWATSWFLCFRLGKLPGASWTPRTVAGSQLPLPRLPGPLRPLPKRRGLEPESVEGDDDASRRKSLKVGSEFWRDSGSLLLAATLVLDRRGEGAAEDCHVRPSILGRAVA